MSKFFIHRPVFAGVIAIIIVLAGFVSANLLAVAQYPEMLWDLMRLVPERMRALDHRNVPVLREARPKYPATSEWRGAWWECSEPSADFSCPPPWERWEGPPVCRKWHLSHCCC